MFFSVLEFTESHICLSQAHALYFILIAQTNHGNQEYVHAKDSHLRKQALCGILTKTMAVVGGRHAPTTKPHRYWEEEGQWCGQIDGCQGRHPTSRVDIFVRQSNKPCKYSVYGHWVSDYSVQLTFPTQNRLMQTGIVTTDVPSATCDRSWKHSSTCLWQ